MLDTNLPSVIFNNIEIVVSGKKNQKSKDYLNWIDGFGSYPTKIDKIFYKKAVKDLFAKGYSILCGSLQAFKNSI